jgi:uncharacterized BrkB/YihY/UPF0761 family membrane protein
VDHVLVCPLYLASSFCLCFCDFSMRFWNSSERVVFKKKILRLLNLCFSFLLFFLFDIELSVVLPYRIIYLFGIFPLFLKLLWHTTYLYTVQIRFLMKIHDHIVFLPLKHKFKRRNIFFLNTTLSELFQNLIEKSQKQRQKLDAISRFFSIYFYK